ncbi:MAG: zf-HC2 domain-containing protein, partial [Rhodothermales bacterium]
MLSCEQVNNFILDYLEDRLPQETHAKFEKHLKMCATCTPFLDQYKQT